MPRIQLPPSQQNLGAFLDTIRLSEGTSNSPTTQDSGYDQIVGRTRFTSYVDHPNISVWLPNLGIHSTAAGGYQILHGYWETYKAQLNLPDFSPVSQDHVAIQLINECHATTLIAQGYISQALVACNSRWASLPGSAYGQHVNQMADLLRAFTNAGGMTNE